MVKQPNSNIVKIDMKAQLSLARLNHNKSITKLSIDKSPKEKNHSKAITLTSSTAIQNTQKGSNAERVNSGLTRRVVNNASKLSSGSLTNHS
jgi:hypothetical protein